MERPYWMTGWIWWAVDVGEKVTAGENITVEEKGRAGNVVEEKVTREEVAREKVAGEEKVVGQNVWVFRVLYERVSNAESMQVAWFQGSKISKGKSTVSKEGTGPATT